MFCVLENCYEQRCSNVTYAQTQVTDVLPSFRDGSSKSLVVATTKFGCSSGGLTITHPVGLVHVAKPGKFGVSNFKMWQQKMKFYLTTLGLKRFFSEVPPTQIENKLRFFPSPVSGL